jgi:RNA polymerase sigma-70 factor (ECF subfamily)
VSRLEFDQVYRTHYASVHRWVRALGGPDCDREDIVQDVFVIVHRRLPDFDDSNLPAWLYKITRRRVRDFRRLAWFKSLFRSGEMSDALESPSETAEEKLSGHQEAAEKTRLLSQLLDHLTEAQRAAFVLFEIEGYTGEQIAELQGAPLNTVWARIRRARMELIARGQRMQRAAAGRAEC